MTITYHEYGDVNGWDEYVTFARDHGKCLFIFSDPAQLIGPVLGMYAEERLNLVHYDVDVAIVRINMENEDSYNINGARYAFDCYEPGAIMVMYVEDMYAKDHDSMPKGIADILKSFATNLQKKNIHVSIVTSNAVEITNLTPGGYPNLQQFGSTEVGLDSATTNTTCQTEQYKLCANCGPIALTAATNRKCAVCFRWRIE
ncbi:hypothetical protein GGH95_000340 [Coemansia sp. RSA 1836]|nr:hypothetical protein GGH95_000340 [Coemansia sp. RSA 1836]